MPDKIITKFFITAVAAILLTACGKADTDKPDTDKAVTVPPTIVVEGPDRNDTLMPDAADDDKTADSAMEDDNDMSMDEQQKSVKTYDPDEYFYAEEISDDLFARMQGKSYPDDCSVARDELCHLVLLYKDINGDTHEGEMVCNIAISDKLTDIFRQLYDADYPIEKMVLIDEYDGNDDASMSDNNTSCFNYRVVSGTNKISKHGYGLAVDLNPRYNPYIHKINGEELIEPENGIEYADRTADFDYKIDTDDLAYKLFTQAGFTWGGSWKNSKDYQHFQM